MSERGEIPKISRRDFLYSFGASVAAIGLSMLLPPPFEQPPNREDVTFRVSDGIAVAGEDRVFEVNDRQLRARVNEECFLKAIDAIGKHFKLEQEVDTFLGDYQMRIVLHARMPGATGRYYYSGVVRYPEMQFSTDYLTAYASSRAIGNADQLAILDKTVYHELWHLVQDATGKMDWYMAGGRFPLFTAAALWFMPKLRNRQQLFEIAGKNVSSKQIASYLKNYELPPAMALALSMLLLIARPDEIEAGINESKPRSWPELSEVRGSFFSFRLV